MKFLIFAFAIGTIIFCSCSPLSTSATAIHAPETLTITPSETRLPTASYTPDITPTPKPSPTATPTLGFDLPAECSSLDLSNGDCDRPTISPDGSWIFFAVPYEITTKYIRYEGRIVSALQSQSKSYPIYRSTCGYLYSEWTDSGYLVLSDIPLEVGCGYTVVYDPQKNKILATLDGALRHVQGWAQDKSAFYTMSPITFGSACKETLSGFDFQSMSSFPAITSNAPGANVYVVIGYPVWMPESKILLANIREGKCNEENNRNDCIYSNSYILEISFTDSSIRTSRAFYDPAVDFFIKKSMDGKVEFLSHPATSPTCQEVEAEEEKLNYQQ